MAERKKVSPLVEIGSTGLKETGGWVLEEWHPRLSGMRGVEIYREMRDNDPIIGGFLLYAETSARSVPWTVKPANEEDEMAATAAQFLRECMDDMSFTWSDLIAEAFSFIPFGWAYFEEVYKIRRGPKRKDPRFRSKFNDGRVGWRKFAVRAQETLWKWEFDEDGGIRGMWQWDPYSAKVGDHFIPIERSVLFRTATTKNNPEGRSLFRNAYVPYRYVKQFRKIEGIGIERELAGLPIFFVPPHFLTDDATKAEKDTVAYLRRIAQQIRADERIGLVLPNSVDIDGQGTGYDAKLWSTGGKRAMEPGKPIERYEKRIATVFLADWLLLGQSEFGTQALSSDKTNIGANTIGSLLGMIKDTINRISVRRLFEMNPDFPEESWPTLEIGDIESRDLAVLGDFISKIAAALGMEGTPALERWLLAQAGAPEPEDDRDLEPERTEGGVTPSSPVADIAEIKEIRETLMAVSAGKLTPEAAESLFSIAFNIPEEDAKKLLSGIEVNSTNQGG